MRPFLRLAFVACSSLGLAYSLSGCSLSGLDDFAIPDCTNNTDCAPLNEEKGIGADSCEVYQCRKAGVGCELRPRDMDDDGYLDRVCTSRAAEVVKDGGFDCDDSEKTAHPRSEEKCDGIDNDCNGLIDDGVAPKLKRTATLGLIGESMSVVFGDAEGSEPRVTVAAATGSAWTSEVQSDTPDTAAESLAFAYLSKQNQADTETPSLECPNPDGTETACSFSEAAVTAFGRASASDDSGARSIVAAINTLGCAHGQVRIGYLKGATEVVLHGPDVHSNLFEGVDVTSDRCTGASRSAGPLGARRINIAGLPKTVDSFPQALSVWLADSATPHAQCLGSEVMVEALGAWLEKTGNATDVFWTNGTNDGVPESLGATRGDGRPAIVAIDEDAAAGYFVAYGASGGGIALHFLPRFEEPPAYTFDGSELRETPKLGAALSVALAEGAAADHVSLSVARTSDGQVELGVTWLDGGCDVARAVMFERVTFDVAEGTVVEGDAVLVAKDARREVAASLAVSTGLVTSSFQGDHDEAIDTGGYLVAWTSESGKLKLARIASHTGDLVGPEVTMGSAAVGGPLLFDSDGPVLAMYSDAGEVLSGRALCE